MNDFYAFDPLGGLRQSGAGDSYSSKTAPSPRPYPRFK